jgi:hypothetical protein
VAQNLCPPEPEVAVAATAVLTRRGLTPQQTEALAAAVPVAQIFTLAATVVPESLLSVM